MSSAEHSCRRSLVSSLANQIYLIWVNTTTTGFHMTKQTEAIAVNSNAPIFIVYNEIQFR